MNVLYIRTNRSQMERKPITKRQLELVEKVATLIKQEKPTNNWFDTCGGASNGEIPAWDKYVKTGRLTEDEFYRFQDLLPATEFGQETILLLRLETTGSIKTLYNGFTNKK
jgi:hypothetical protein